MSALAEFLARPRAPRPRYIIDPVAFFIALIGGPLLFTFATFWMLFIPVAALGFGGLPYLVLVTPVLLIHLSRNPAKPSVLARLALLTLFCFTTFMALITIAMGDEAAFGSALFFLVFGTFFAPAWAASFGWVYGKLCCDLYAHPIHV